MVYRDGFEPSVPDLKGRCHNRLANDTFGGDEGSRTPVLKPIHLAFYILSYS